ncbi:MAG: hypothetical protein LBF27_06815 [Sphingobacterium sp.]|jgi:hypothetical protein|nr:hypothetical protein [Sphingobacterium sp.]
MRIKHLLLLPAIAFSYLVEAQNVFPAGGNTGIGITNPETFLHIKTNGAAAYPSKATRGNVMQLFQADNNDLEIGVANGTNTRRAWILARHVTVPQYGEHYSTLHLQPKIDVMDFYRGVAVGYPANVDMPWGVGLVVEGNVGIGTLTPQEKLSVKGKIRAQEVKVETTNWPDYVFEPGYKLPSLSETERFIRENGHLPEVPKAAEVEENGIYLGEMNKILLKKIEELTLQAIAEDKLRSKQQEVIEQQSKAISKLEQRLDRLEIGKSNEQIRK